MSNPQEEVFDKLHRLCCAWSAVAIPNEPIEGYDLSAVESHIERIRTAAASREIDSSAAASFLQILEAPSLSEDAFDYTWLVVHWHISQIRELLFAISGIEQPIHDDTQSAADFFAEHHAEIASINGEIVAIRKDIAEIRANKSELAGISIGAFGVSVSLDTIQRLLSRASDELGKAAGQVRIEVVVIQLRGAFEQAKEILQLATKAPEETTKSVTRTLRDMAERAGRALVAALRIQSKTRKPTSLYVNVRMKSNLDFPASGWRDRMWQLETSMLELVSEYEVRVIDYKFFSRIDACFRKTAFLVEVNQGREKFTIAEAIHGADSHEHKQSFRLGVGKRASTFSMDPIDFARLVSKFIADVGKLGRSGALPSGRINVSEYGGIIGITDQVNLDDIW